MEQWLDLQNPLFGKDEWCEVGKEIRRRRKRKKWTQEDLAGYMDSDHRVVSRHENGESMSVETLVKYARILGCTTDALLPANIRGHEFGGFVLPLQETLRIVATLSAEDQLGVNGILLGAVKLAKKAS